MVDLFRYLASDSFMDEILTPSSSSQPTQKYENVFVVNVPGFGKEDLEAYVSNQSHYPKLVVKSKEDHPKKLLHYITLPRGVSTEDVGIVVDKGQMKVTIDRKQQTKEQPRLIEIM